MIHRIIFIAGLALSLSFSVAGRAQTPEALAAFKLAAANHGKPFANDQAATENYAKVQTLLKQLNSRLGRLKSLAYALAQQDLGSADTTVQLKFSQAVILGYSLRAGGGVRRTVDEVYPLISLSAHVGFGAGSFLTGSLNKDRSANRHVVGVVPSDDAQIGFILAVEQVDGIDGEGPVYDGIIKKSDEGDEALEVRIKEAEASGQLIPKWQFWRRGKRNQQIEALGTSEASDETDSNLEDKFGVAKEGEGFGLGALLYGDLFGVGATIPMKFLSRRNDEVKSNLDRSLAALSTLDQLAKSGQIFKESGLQIAQGVVGDFAEKVEALDTAIKNSSSYIAYSKIPDSLDIDEDSTFTSPENLVGEKSLPFAIAGQEGALRGRACDIMKAI